MGNLWYFYYSFFCVSKRMYQKLTKIWITVNPKWILKYEEFLIQSLKGISICKLLFLSRADKPWTRLTPKDKVKTWYVSLYWRISTNSSVWQAITPWMSIQSLGKFIIFSGEHVQIHLFISHLDVPLWSKVMGEFLKKVLFSQLS